MRLTRLIIGFLVILAAGFVIVGEQLSGASADAVINARVTTIRSPIAGTLALESRPLGSLVSGKEALGWIQNPIVDDGKRTMMMDAIDLAALGLDPASSSGSMPVVTDEDSGGTGNGGDKNDTKGKKKKKRR